MFFVSDYVSRSPAASPLGGRSWRPWKRSGSWRNTWRTGESWWVGGGSVGSVGYWFSSGFCWFCIGLLVNYCIAIWSNKK